MANETVRLVPAPDDEDDSNLSWSSGIFDCADDCLICCFALWCPVCQIAKNKATVEDSDHISICDLIMAILCPVCCGGYVRTRVRRKLFIRGSGAVDFCCACCCFTCAIAQDTRELSLRGYRHARLCS